MKNPFSSSTAKRSMQAIPQPVEETSDVVAAESILSGHMTPMTGQLAPRPTTIEQTGLSLPMLEDLITKYMLEAGTLDIQKLTAFLALSGPVIESMLTILRGDGRIEVKGPAGGDARALRYSLSDRGKIYAKDALLRSGYIGPAPVPLEVYREIMLEQSVRKHNVGHDVVHENFSDMVIKPGLLNQLGAAMHSGKAIFIYGAPGTGKTFACQKLARLLGAPVLIPHAVAVGDSIVRVFDDLLHTPIAAEGGETLLLAEGFDPRFERCERPFITSGGELTGDLLEIQYDESSRQYRAPLQLKASNGIYLIDDLGRQKMPTAELFNRWIVPMESGEDFLNMRSGNRMVVPFDLILIFSTNLDPKDLADAAFLRRIGHKIRFDYLEKDEYVEIWKGVCDQRNLPFDAQIVDYVVENFHEQRGVPMLACHPRDLIGIAMDHVNYSNGGGAIDRKTIDIAWDTNFVNFN